MRNKRRMPRRRAVVAERFRCRRDDATRRVRALRGRLPVLPRSSAASQRAGRRLRRSEADMTWTQHRLIGKGAATRALARGRLSAASRTEMMTCAHRLPPDAADAVHRLAALCGIDRLRREVDLEATVRRAPEATQPATNGVPVSRDGLRRVVASEKISLAR
jgi:hypothetical protein